MCLNLENKNKIRFMKKEAHLIDDYLELGINIKQNINKILNQINELRLKNNPIILKKNDLKEILND